MERIYLKIINKENSREENKQQNKSDEIIFAF